MRCREGLIVISSTPKNLPEGRVSKAIDTDKFAIHEGNLIDRRAGHR